MSSAAGRGAHLTSEQATADGSPASAALSAAPGSSTTSGSSAPGGPGEGGLGPEDVELVALARSVVGPAPAEGAAVRDGDGRTHVAASVALPSLRRSALSAALGIALGGGARSVQAAAVVTDAEVPADRDLAAVRDLGGPGTPVLVVGRDGQVRRRCLAV